MSNILIVELTSLFRAGDGQTEWVFCAFMYSVPFSHSHPSSDISGISGRYRRINSICVRGGAGPSNGWRDFLVAFFQRLKGSWGNCYWILYCGNMEELLITAYPWGTLFKDTNVMIFVNSYVVLSFWALTVDLSKHLRSGHADVSVCLKQWAENIAKVLNELSTSILMAFCFYIYCISIILAFL